MGGGASSVPLAEWASSPSPRRAPADRAPLGGAAVEPVKEILSTLGSVTSRSDTSRSAVTTFTTPAGRPTASATSANTYPAAGASGDTFSTTVQPASSAGAALLTISWSGPFHGMMAPTTPTGSRHSRPKSPPGTGEGFGVTTSSKG